MKYNMCIVKIESITCVEDEKKLYHVMGKRNVSVTTSLDDSSMSESMQIHRPCYSNPAAESVT
jgi:hypothetical protein